MSEAVGIAVLAMALWASSGLVLWYTADIPLNVIPACEAACVDNGGIRWAELDGDCGCKNGAEFDGGEVKKK